MVKERDDYGIREKRSGTEAGGARKRQHVIYRPPALQRRAKKRLNKWGGREVLGRPRHVQQSLRLSKKRERDDGEGTPGLAI